MKNSPSRGARKYRLSRGIIGAAIVMLLAPLGGCALLEQHEPTRLPVTLDFDYQTVKLPLDEYRISTPELQAKYAHAQSLAVDSCMVKAGFEPMTGTVDWNAVGPTNANQFGLFSVALAQRNGFDPDPSIGTIPAARIAPGASARDAYGSCKAAVDPGFEQATDLLRNREDLAGKLSDEAVGEVRGFPAGIDAFEKIRRCLESHNVPVNSETGRADYDSMAVTADAKRDFAVEDATCAVETGAIQTLYELLAGRQQDLIKRHQDDLNSLRAERDATAVSLDAMIAGGGTK